MADVVITKEQVDEIFESAKNQQDYIIGLYKLVVPRWDEVEDVGGYPKVNYDTRIYLMEKAMEWDRQHLPGSVMPGGAWMNWGWSDDDYLADWEVSLDDCKTTYKDK